jgi:HAD superfamily hydrolase (TIGR01490 family)
MEPPRIALFDLDGTLLAEDTQLLFCNFVLRRHALRRLFLVFFLPFSAGAALRVLGARELKRVFLSYLWLMPRERLERYAREFARAEVAPRMFPELRAEIERHRREGRTLVLNSASPEFYVREIGAVLGFDHAFGTIVQVRNRQRLIAEIEGPNNKGRDKLPRMTRAGLFPCDTADSWAYSDSAADLPMLDVVRNVVLVNPRPRLAALGADRGWAVVRPARPWQSRAGQAVAIIRQVLGLYR